MIAVVIPYFQREPGILRRALDSVAAQRDCPEPLHLIVVDDASPVPAASELRGFEWPGASIDVLRQANAGPGAARNAGLDRVPAGARYVAFLDSDDQWSADHLARAVAALDGGFDFYFADLYQLGQTTGAFARGGRIVPAEHPAITDGAVPTGLHAYSGDMFDQIVRGNVIGTPTVVYRFERFASARFRTDLTSAGEDYLFWMTLVRAGVRIAFSSQVEVMCGRGVNVYSGARWGTDEFFVRVRNELTYRKATGNLFDVSDVQRAHLRRCVTDLRRAFAASVLHRLRRRERIPAPLLRAQWRTDPLSFAMIPVAGALSILRRT